MATKKTKQPAPQSKFVKEFTKRAGSVDIGFSRYQVGVDEAPPLIAGRNTLAFVPTLHGLDYDKRLKGNTIYLNEPALENATLGQRGENYVLNHEVSHLQQTQYDKRMGKTKNYDRSFIEAYQQASLNRGKKVDYKQARRAVLGWLESTAARKGNGDMLKGIKGDTTKGYYDMFRQGELDLREQVADLHAAERMSYKRLRDNPNAAQALFNNDEAMMDAYDAMTGYRLDRYDARDLPPATPTAPVKPIETSLFSGFKKMVGWN